MFRSFMRRFVNAFGLPVQPALLLIHKTAPRTFRFNEALFGLRDAISVSTVSYQRALEISRRSGDRVCYADAFSFYPWMVDNKFQGLACLTEAMAALDTVEGFQGQPMPSVPLASMGEEVIDRPVLEAILSRWLARFRSKAANPPDVALFRSLNMAHHACLISSPASGSTLYDIGRQIALWVAAFEILGHPHSGKTVNLNSVMDMFDRVDWLSREFRARRYRICYRNKVQRRPLAAALYARLYFARNAFLHGNPVSRKTLKIQSVGPTLFDVAAPLYRLALTSFLDLRPQPIEGELDPEAFGAAIARRLELHGYQETHEEALLTAWFGRDRQKSLRKKFA
ncbi:MAG: hypothetical protein INF65_13670 [Roseomonas sp.]|nr:hypothetical protein [Roseomonas sp.]MCA3407183.1 hypothetical protein [Roseomonas sp.]